MPLYPDAEAKIKANLEEVKSGNRPKIVAIGKLTDTQLSDINAVRRGLNLHEIEDPEILYMGRHHYESRTKDGYSIEDMWLQIKSAMAETSVAISNLRMTTIQNSSARDDGYGNTVRDMAVLELSQRKPRAELYSAIPKGDHTPPKSKRPT